MIQLETKNNYCKCNADLEEFQGPDLIENASMEIKGALFSMLLREIPLFIAITGKEPKDVVDEVQKIIPFNKQEFLQFVKTVTHTQDDHPAQ